MNTPLQDYLAQVKQQVEAMLDTLVPGENEPPVELHRAVRHSLFAGGKRLRPALVIAAAEACGGDRRLAMPVACALEMVHTSSEMHDDLPCLDNADTRRGKPACHRLFGEAVALLAGDWLMTVPFQIVAQCGLRGDLSTEATLGIIGEIGLALGSAGMIAGQVVDLLQEGQPADDQIVDYLYAHKTGALITASVRCGGLVAGGTAQQMEALTEYGQALGRAFQIADDLLDVTATEEELGKPVGSDARHLKATYVALHGLEAARAEARRLAEGAQAALRPWCPHFPLIPLAEYAVTRTY